MSYPTKNGLEDPAKNPIQTAPTAMNTIYHNPTDQTHMEGDSIGFKIPNLLPQ